MFTLNISSLYPQSVTPSTHHSINDAYRIKESTDEYDWTFVKVEPLKINNPGSSMIRWELNDFNASSFPRIIDWVKNNRGETLCFKKLDALCAQGLFNKIIQSAKDIHITTLDVSHSTIDQDGWEALCKLIKSDAQIERLNLSFCEINNPKKVSALTAALKNNRSIQELLLQGNKLGLNGLLALKNMLASNKEIKVQINSQIKDTNTPMGRNLLQTQEKFAWELPNLIIHNLVENDQPASCDCNSSLKSKSSLLPSNSVYI